MSQPRPNLDWYRKQAKLRLAERRRTEPEARLADVQLAIAREHGHPSWRAMRSAIAARRRPEAARELVEALHRHDERAVRRLLRDDPELAGVRSPDGQTPLHVAVETDQPALVEALLAAGANPAATLDLSAHSALSWALTVDAFRAARALVRAGTVPDLFCAAGLGELATVQSFFDEAGAVRSAASRTGSSRFTPDWERLPRPPVDPIEVVSDALYLACRCNQPDVVQFLLERDADPNFRAFYGGTPLHWAHFSGSVRAIELLLAAGADPTMRDHVHGCDPRAFGVCVPANWGLTRRLGQNLDLDPALLEVRGGHGTPLHEAARNGAVSTIELLLSRRADPAAHDPQGRTPAELAEAGGHQAALALLNGRNPQTNV